jgi:tetratricopeptide (TPR) repeat protein
VNSRLENWDASKKNFEDALKIDPAYFDAQYHLAQIFYSDAVKVKKQMDALGISAADKKKKVELDKILVEKFKLAVPYMENAEKLNPSDTDVLEKLSNMYYNLGEDAKLDRVSKRLKELGVSE